MRRRCHRLVRELDLPKPFKLDALLEYISTRRNKKLHVHPFPGILHHVGLYGMWISLDDDDFIFYEQHTSPLHQEHIILHEIGHILTHDAEKMERESIAMSEIAVSKFYQLMPDMPREEIRQALARSHCSSPTEIEAELIASLIHKAADQPLLPASPGVAGLLEAQLGFRAG